MTEPSELEWAVARVLDFDDLSDEQWAGMIARWSLVDGSDIGEALKYARAAIAECCRWRPIETAPKDGPCVDVWCAREDGTGYRHIGRYWFDWPGRLQLLARPLYTAGMVELTHWLPIPPPPPTGDGSLFHGFWWAWQEVRRS